MTSARGQTDKHRVFPKPVKITFLRLDFMLALIKQLVLPLPVVVSTETMMPAVASCAGKLDTLVASLN
jgi:hypothetical protein